MTISHLYRIGLLLLAGWLLAVQSFSSAHATVYGDEPHEHEGVACAVLVLGEDELAALPQVETPSFIQTTSDKVPALSFTSYLYTTPQGRAPPPRAPPVSL